MLTKQRSAADRVAFVGLVAGFVSMIAAVVAVVTSVSVPYRIDNDAQNREVRRICIESVLDLRAGIVKLSGRYAGTTPARSAVQADWDAALAAVEQTRVSCRDLTLHTAGSVENNAQLWQQLDTAENQATQAKAPDSDALTAVTNWTTAAIKDLTSTH